MRIRDWSSDVCSYDLRDLGIGIGDWEGPRRHFITRLAVFRDQKRHDPAFAGPQVDPDIGGRIGIRLLSESGFPNPQSRPYRSSPLDMSSSAPTSSSEQRRVGKEGARTRRYRGA